MNLDMYRSTKVDGLFVTLPSHEARAIIGLVDELSALGLDPVLLAYQPSDSDEQAASARFVLAEIIRKGYATHGRDGLPFLMPGVRAVAHRQPLPLAAK